MVIRIHITFLLQLKRKKVRPPFCATIVAPSVRPYPCDTSSCAPLCLLLLPLAASSNRSACGRRNPSCSFIVANGGNVISARDLDLAVHHSLFFSLVDARLRACGLRQASMLSWLAYSVWLPMLRAYVCPLAPVRRCAMRAWSARGGSRRTTATGSGRVRCLWPCCL